MKVRLQYALLICSLVPILAVASVTRLAAGAGLTLAARGRTRYVIVIGPNASATVKHAAGELSADLHQISGADFAVTSNQAGRPAIYVGPSHALLVAFPKLALRSLPAEGFFIETSGRNLALAGNDDRGTLYAVYTFLEERLGVRWYSPNDTFIPHRRVVKIPPLHERQAPAFSYRDTDEYMAQTHPQWDAHLKLDGVSVPDRADLGGINQLFKGSENFYQLVPPSKYFAKHPEYYSLINGKRSDAPGSQLSLVNPHVLRIVTAELVAKAKANPGLLTLGLSPNDAGDGDSQGARSRASDARYGAPSGTLLNFVNKVAVAVQKQLPGRDIWFDTLAYQYTEKPPIPGTIKPGPHVLVCLAPIGMDFAHPLASPQNRFTCKCLLGWAKVAPGHLQVWQYVTNFANYLQPFPDWNELGADFQFFHEHGVSGIFCEGDHDSIGEMMAMRTWVMAHLLWNPKQKVWKLVREFSNGYYGPAGRYTYRYLRLLQNQASQPDVRMGEGDSIMAPYLAANVLKKASHLFQKAQAAVKSNPARLHRVQEARLSIRYVELMRRMPAKDSTAAEKAAFLKEFNRFVQALRRFGVGDISESRPVSEWAAAIHKKLSY